MPDVYLGVGSNIDAEHNVERALKQLEQHFGPLLASSVYRSPALGFDGDDFLNLVVRFTTRASATEIDAQLSVIEYAGGRTRAQTRFGPRTLDIDLLIYGCCVDPAARLPREDVAHYPFVLGPLAEIAPRLVHPVGGYLIADAWQAMRDRVVLERVGAWNELRSAARGRSPADAAPAVDG